MNKIREDDWRNDPSLESTTTYQRKFALFPVMCNDGTRVWLKPYYKKYVDWYHKHYAPTAVFNTDDYCHTDFHGCVSEEEYVIMKLSETL